MGWDVSNVISMSYMFKTAELFNQDISGWNVYRFTSITHMFDNAKSFNQDLRIWNTKTDKNL